MTHVITQPCCNDASCVPVCPVDCIHPTPDEPDYPRAEMLYIDPATCIDCGACVDVCPVQAILPDDDLTPTTAPYLDINAAWYEGRPPPAPVERAVRDVITAPAGSGPLRVAVVGSGPAAFYTAEALLSRRDLDAEVEMFERLPTPGGLVRFGVAPDHTGTKAVTKDFARTAGRRDFRFHLNVEVGVHITHEELLAHHHAVVYAIGAPGDRAVGVPGEDLPGSHSATDFVAWYNGHPDAAGLSFDFSGERAAVVGNGNVALDVARILVTDVDVLARTDIADHALAALGESKIREVVVLGRRGPAQAGYTTPELLGLAEVEGVDVVVDPTEVALDAITRRALDDRPDPVLELKLRITAELAARPARGHDRRIVLRYLTSPEEILGEDRVRGVRIGHNELVDHGGGRIAARATGWSSELQCGLVLRAVGYRGSPVPGLPFDSARGVLPNAQGRVLDPARQRPIAGVYTAGWIKRGPTGVIGTNKWCAEDTVRALLADYQSGALPSPAAGGEALAELVASRQPRVVDLAGWKAIDLHERKADRSRPRVKVVDVETMLAIAGAAPAS